MRWSLSALSILRFQFLVFANANTVYIRKYTCYLLLIFIRTFLQSHESLLIYLLIVLLLRDEWLGKADSWRCPGRSIRLGVLLSGLALGSATCWPSESERKEAFPGAFYAWGFPGGSDSKEYACNSGDLGSVTGLRRGPGEGNGNPLQYFCLEYSMDRGAWQVIVHGVTNSRRRLSNEHFFHFLCMRHFHTLLYYFTNFSYSHTIFITVSIFKCHV